MTMKRFIVLPLLLLFTLSCHREPNPVDDGKDGPVVVTPTEFVLDGACTFTASFAEAFSTDIPAWSEGDQVILFGAENASAVLTLSSISSGKAVFKGEAKMKGPFYAVWPASSAESFSEGEVVLSLPSNLKTGAAGVIPCVAKTTDSTLVFHGACSLLELRFSGEGIAGATLSVKDGSSLAGKFRVNGSTGEVLGIEAGSDCIVLTPSGSSITPGTCYVPVIPGEKVEVEVSLSRTEDARKGTRPSGTEVERVRGRSQLLGSFNLTGLEWGYRIANYEDLLAWRGDSAHWDPEGETVVIIGDINMKDEPWTPLTDSYPGELLGNGHCISHINIQSSALAHLGFFGKDYSKEIHDLILGSEDGKTYDGTSCIISGYNTSSTTSYWSYTAPVTLPGADIENLTNFIPVTVTASSNRSSRVGGIAAWATGKNSISGCHNYGTITVENHPITEGSSYKYLSAAGILGGANTASAEVTVSNCHNHASVTSRNSGEFGMGGIIGVVYHTCSSVSIDNCTNEGRLELLYSETQNDAFSIGGIGGKISGDPGQEVTVHGCTNRGDIYSEAVHQHYVGGITGCGDGVRISDCINEGRVMIDHSAHASTRFQVIGGILGGTTTSYGENFLTDNVNTGEVSMKVASSGHNKTPSSSSVFYGVNAGGIVGMASGVTSLERNRNEGKVLAENAFSASKAAYPAIVHAGGIVGYDLGVIDYFSENEFTGTLNAETTTATSVPSEIYAGGIIGRLQSSTMQSGAGKGTVTTKTADESGKHYAGSVAGYNEGTIASCVYGGTVNGKAADESNIVGGGTAPASSGGDSFPAGVFAVSEAAVSFPGSGYTQTLLRVTTGEKPVTVSAKDIDWIKTSSIPSEIAAMRSVTIPVQPRNGNVSEKRSGTLTFSEQGGDTKSVTLSQDNLYTAVDGFPARWEITKGVTYTESNEAGKRWIREGIAATVAASDAPSNNPGTGYITVGSTTGNELVLSVAPGGTQTLSVGNMGSGDYIQFSVPVTTLPAGTDVDFMLTINTNNNKTPKYFIFEYWDKGSWNAQPRYKATEDGTDYSFDVYDYDSKNHRTYITTFQLSEPVSGDFVKMRVRAVGSVNCSGSALTPSPSAFINLPCMTYHACEIAAYPGVSAKESKPVKLLQLGNSFTYYHGSAFKLKQICRAEGHATDVRINVKGSQEFEHHLDVLPFSQRLVAEGGYDRAILQDGSYFHAEYGLGDASKIADVTPKYSPEEILALTRRMSAAVKEKSPSAEIILESVWSYSYKTTGNYLGFGSFDAFDEMMWKGSTAIASADENINYLSPIGKAFAKARSEGGFGAAYNYLLYTDNYHPSRYGSYLKACVNYLILFGEPFGAHPADCDIPSEDAAKLRSVAEKIVFGSDFRVR